MSELSVAAHKAHARLARWLANKHPNDSEAQAIAAEAEALAAGAKAAAPDLPALVRDVPVLAIAAGKLLADLLGKTANIADFIEVGRDAAPVIADVERALADFKAAYVAHAKP